MSEAEFDEDSSSNNQGLFENDRESDEDTEDASETDMVKNESEYMEIKEQIYQDKLFTLKDQLKQLKEGIHPEYTKKLKLLELHYQDRIFLNDAYLSVELDRIEQEYINEKRAAVRDYEDRKVELKENLIIELEEKKKMVENERISLEFNSDSYEPKPATTRKLRRRPNDPTPAPEKRKRGSPAQLNQLLEDSDILDDLKIINKAVSIVNKDIENDNIFPFNKNDHSSLTDAKIEDGKLYFEKKWYHRGQQINVKYADNYEFNGILSSIGTSEIWIKKSSDNSKFRIFLSNLQKGKYKLQRRAS